MRENNREDEPNQCTLNAYMEILQWNLLYNYYILIKNVKKKPKPYFNLYCMD
jgi:hypothetical protein